MILNEKDGLVLVDSRLDIKVMLSGLWVVLMILYLYCDFFALYKSGAIQMIMDGFMGPFQVSQATLVSGSLLMIVPACMVFLSLSVNARINRWLNIIAGLLYTLVGIGNIIGETMIFYIIFVVIEWAVTISIVALAVKWPRRRSESH